MYYRAFDATARRHGEHAYVIDGIQRTLAYATVSLAILTLDGAVRGYLKHNLHTLAVHGGIHTPVLFNQGAYLRAVACGISATRS